MEKRMLTFPINAPSNILQCLVDLVKNEAQYLCCLENHVENFERKKKILAAKQQDVKINIENASGVSRVKNEAQQWIHEADSLIEVDTETKKKWFFGLCPNCYRQYHSGKELAKKTLEIDELLGRCSFNIVGGPVDLPSLKYHSLPSFIDFESRKLKFQDLLEALEDENCNLIGLQGMGGTGKTSMAIEVGVKLEESKYHSVILLDVSNPPDFKKIRGEIARHLNLTLEEGKEKEHSKTIWSRITNKKEKLLIILDDVWEEFDLIKDIGIPSSHQHKGCSVLIISRNLNVCEVMGCQRMIQLDMLVDKEAFNLFLIHANTSSSRLKGIAQNIVKQCGGLPIAIVAVARALRNRPLAIWREALKTLQNSKSMIDVNQNLTKIYKCLKLSYDNLKNEKAKKLFLICSIFPKDFEISVELLSRIGIGVGLFGEVEKYCTTRSKVLAAIQELVDSCLLLNLQDGLVKMHDLVREVALWIADKDIQVIMDFKTTIEANLRYLFWNSEDFPNQFDGTNLEIFIINVNGSEDLKVPYSFFIEMTKLRVLHLKCTYVHSQILDSSLLYSLQSLMNIQTLSLMNLKLGDISILGNLPSLVTLELNHCSIIELSEEILGLKRLRLLEIRACKVKMNNPFEVIERCSQLEELYFVDNGNFINENIDFQNLSPLTLQRYQISSIELLEEFEKYGLISRYFFPHDLRPVISEETFKQLVGAAELLILGGYDETRWKNLVPDIVHMECGGMNDLIILHMYSWPDIQCLIDTRNHYFDVIAFSKLIELHLFEMDIEDLYRGSLPSGFLEQLETMELKSCLKLQNMLFNGKLNLCHLKAMELKGCVALTSIFQLSTARSLVLLEELTINDCHALEHIVFDDSSKDEIVGDDNGYDQKSHDSLFPKLKTLRIARCDNLEMILPVLFARGLPPLEVISICECEKLKYMFSQYREEDHVLHQNEQAVMLPLMKEMKLSRVPSFIDIYREHCKLMSSSMQGSSSSVPTDIANETLLNPNAHACSWAPICCFPHESKATSEETKASATISKEEKLADLTTPLGLYNTAQCITRQLFHFRNIKKMKLVNFPNLLSLFSLSIASMIMWEELTIEKWDDLKHMITNDVDDRNDQITYKSIFPKLEKLEIWDCKDLEFLFPSTLFGGLKNLKFLTIKNAPELKYIFGKYPLEDHLLNLNQNDELQFDLPALEVLCLGDVQKIISICAMNYYLTWPSLHMVVLENCNIESFTDLMVCSDEGRLKWKAMKELDASRGGIPPFQASQNPLLQPLNNIRTMRLVSCSRLVSLLALPIASKILLEVLIIEECHELKCIVADEEDAQALMNFNSIFSKLKELHVSRCRTLEYLFPASLFRSPTHLKYVTIAHAPKLKYVFGTSHHEDSSHESQNIEAYIDFPVLESLNLEVIPNLVSIFPQNYYLTGLSLKSIVLDMSPEFIIKSFTDFMSGRHASQCDSTTSKVIENRIQTMTDLTVHYSNVEDIFNLAQSKVERNREGLEPVTSSLEYLTLGNLSELRNICEGPKYILSLNNLKKLNITSCKKLKTVFSISILKSLPELWKLEISDCEELVHIVGEDIEENASDRLSHEPCFPKLHELHVKSCNMLKYLFSISMSGILPNLMFLSIKEASKLKHVIISHVEMKEMVMTDVLPELYYLIFEELPSLVDVCHGIDFQAVRISSEVYNCPNFSFYENSTTHLQVGLENLDSKVQVAKDENLSSHLNTHQFGMRKAEGSQDLETQQSSIGSPNLTRVVEVTPKEGPSSNTSHPCPLDSTKPMALVPMSPILIALPTEGSSFTIIEIFEEEEEEEEEGGLITICRCQRGIKEVSSLIPEGPQITCRGAPLPLINAPLLETSIQALLHSEGSDQDDVGTTNQLIREAVDTIQVSKNSNALAIVPSKDGNVETIGPLTTFFEHASDGITEEVSLVQNECEVNSSCFDDDEITRESDASSFDELLRDDTSEHGGQVNRSGDFGASLSALEGRERESSYSKETTPPFSMTDYVLTVPGVQEIVNMMNLEGVEPFLLAKVFKSHPQLRLPTENRSTRILFFSYRVLLDILNILATRTPLSITESDKRLLAENLEDASTLGFDNNWLESIKTKVFGCDISEAHHALELLKGLDNKLNAIEKELTTICEQEEEAALAVQVAQKELEAAQIHLDSAQLEHANVKTRHSQLLEAQQHILAQQDECWEAIAAKDKHFDL
ncbi:uncharacterized protein LOC129313598 isoform X3 [Prosopis cineraria]|uniref:uncharacterized protein LOC129313598 isoform X3 n=1 Tax=Prosopis cineraria TaxID=364024 RepID=UPI00240F6542|nr:uncharacterized protein LOC129313598 isoform X3 [Prosopis cineraria]